MLNVCFSEQAENVLKDAVRFGYLIESEIICIPDDLSLGNISNIKNFETRIPVLDSLHQVDGLRIDECQRHYYKFFSQIYNHDHVLIWYAKTPADFCGLLYTLWLLKDTPADIKAVCCSRTLKRGENQYQSYYSVNDLEPGEVIRFFPFETNFSKAELESFHLEWEKLVDENGELRVYWNETIQTANISYYDDILLPYVPAEVCSISDVIHSFVSTERLGVSESFILFRLKAMAKDQKLIIDGDKVRLKEKISMLSRSGKSNIVRVAGQPGIKTV